MDSCASAVILRGCEKILRHPESAKRDEGSQNTTSLQFRDPSPSTRLRMTDFFTTSESAKRDEGSQNTTSLQLRDPSPSTRLRMTENFTSSEPRRRLGPHERNKK